MEALMFNLRFGSLFGFIGLAVVSLVACGKADSFCAGSGTSSSAGDVTCGKSQLCVEEYNFSDDGSSGESTQASCKPVPSACQNGGCTGGNNGAPTTECMTAVAALCAQGDMDVRLTCSSTPGYLFCGPGAP
jgi:hypothetical protein